MDSGQHSLDPSNEVESALARIVHDYGVGTLSDPELLTGLCADALGDLPREARLIVNASKSRIPELLSQRVKDFGTQAAVTMTSTTLCEQESLDPAAATWVVTQLATAMGFGSQPDQPLPPPPVDPNATVTAGTTFGQGSPLPPPPQPQPQPPYQTPLPPPPVPPAPVPPAPAGGIRAPLNGFAIASLVLGIISVSVLAIVFGLVARSQIRKSEGRQRGLGMATAGLILGGVWLVATVLFLSLYHPTPTNNPSNSNPSTIPIPIPIRIPIPTPPIATPTAVPAANPWSAPDQP